MATTLVTSGPVAVDRSKWSLSSSARRGFSLLELLIVIGIITVLIGILLPVLSVAREHANRTACLSNLHQIGVALTLYANENQGRLPNANPAGETSGTDENLIMVDFNDRYLKVPAAFRCASSRLPVPGVINTSDIGEAGSTRMSYDFYSLYWDSDLGPKLTRIGMAPLAWDLNGGDRKLSLEQNHGNKGGNVLFADIHATWQPPQNWDDDNWPHPASQYYDGGL